MDLDNIPAVFDLLREELLACQKELNAIGAAHLTVSDYPRASAVISQAMRIPSFAAKLATLAVEWDRDFRVPIGEIMAAQSEPLIVDSLMDSIEMPSVQADVAESEKVRRVYEATDWENLPRSVTSVTESEKPQRVFDASQRVTQPKESVSDPLLALTPIKASGDETIQNLALDSEDDELQLDWDESDRTRAARTRLRVRFADGVMIAKDTAADTFVLALKTMGLERVRSLGLTVNNYPLLSRRRHDRYASTPIDDYWVITHSGTERKKQLLEDIAERLGFSVNIAILK